MTTLSPVATQVAGWGMAVGGEAQVLRPTTVAEVQAALGLARDRGWQVALRGSGCSYGDAACGTGKVVLDLSNFNRILDFERATGVIRCEAGVTIAQVWRHVLPHGWWPPVVSGTMAPTLGGAAAMNIHGKNAFAVGTLGEHIEALQVVLPSGELRELTPAEPLFRAVISGFGELAVIVGVTLHCKRVHSGLMEVSAMATRDLDEMIEVLLREQGAADYLVGWLDGFAAGASLGRGLVHVARQLAPGEDPDAERTLQVAHQELPPRLFGVIPKSWMWRLMWPFANNLGLRLVNWAKYLSARLLEHGKRYRQSHAAFHFLLDYVPNWKFIYRPGGLIQHQSFVPAAEAGRVLRAVLELSHARGMPPWLAVLKRHRPDPFLLTHGLDGFSLALDFPVTASNRLKLWAMCHEIEQLVVAAGGRFYFAKDATLEPETVRRMFPAESLATFARWRRELDPEGMLATDLYDRTVRAALEAA
jgi:FAD/FMN-containing dehydrogenase